MQPQMIGDSVIGWFNPVVNPPPFEMKLLLMVAGMRSNNCGLTFEPYTEVITASVQEYSPADEGSDCSEFEEYVAGDKADFLDFQFFLKDDRAGDEFDWYSDSIVAWAYYPLGIAQAAINEAERREQRE